MTTARSAELQRARNGRALAKKLRWLLTQSAHANEIRVVPSVSHGRLSDVLRERMETSDGVEFVGRATLTAFRDRRWMSVHRKRGEIGMAYRLTRAGAKAIAE